MSTTRDNSYRQFHLMINMCVFQDAVIIAGWRSVAMVDLVDGRTLAEHSIPCQPQETVVTGDFTNDGLTDVLIVCPKG